MLAGGAVSDLIEEHHARTPGHVRIVERRHPAAGDHRHVIPAVNEQRTDDAAGFGREQPMPVLRRKVIEKAMRTYERVP